MYPVVTYHLIDSLHQKQRHTPPIGLLTDKGSRGKKIKLTV